MENQIEGSASDRNRFKDVLLGKDTFCVTWEQVPGRGASEKERERREDGQKGQELGEEVRKRRPSEPNRFPPQ